LWLCDYC